MATENDPSRSKIGVTKGNPFDRFSQLRCGDPYLVIYAAFRVPEWFGDIFEVETTVHKSFHHCRIKFSHTNLNSEWFQIEPASVINELCEHFEEVGEIRWSMHCLSGRRASDESQHVLLFGNKLLDYMGQVPVDIDD